MRDYGSPKFGSVRSGIRIVPRSIAVFDYGLNRLTRPSLDDFLLFEDIEDAPKFRAMVYTWAKRHGRKYAIRKVDGSEASYRIYFEERVDDT